MTPQRIRLSRAKGWRLPPNTVNVARPGKWGNKFRIGDRVEHIAAPNVVEIVHVNDAATAVRLYRAWMELSIVQHSHVMLPALEELRGKNLACWCELGAPCHGDELLLMANRR